MSHSCASVRQELQALVQIVEKMALAMDQGYDFPPLPVENALEQCFLSFESLPVRDRLNLQPDFAELMIGLQRLEQKTFYALKQKEEGIQISRAAFKTAKAYADSQNPQNTEPEVIS